MKRLLLAAAVLSLPLWLTSVPAQAQSSDPAVCCIQTTSYLDTELNPPIGGDERFLEQGGGPPNVMFLVSNNGTMQNYPKPLPAGNGAEGCSDSEMDWFDLANDGKERFDPRGGTSNDQQLFDPDSYYLSTAEKIPFNDSDGSDTSLTRFSRLTKTQACQKAIGRAYSSATVASCEACLTSKGWWRSRNNLYWALDGQVLNVRPPKAVIVRKVLMMVMDQVSTVRRGMMVFGPNVGAYDPAQYIGSGQAAQLKPPYTSDDCDVKATDRSEVANGLYATEWNNGEQSIAEALFTVSAQYSDGATFWDGLWNTRSPSSDWPSSNWPGSGNWGGGSCNWTPSQLPWDQGGKRPICNECQVSSVILIFDDMAYADNSVPVYKMNRMVGLADPGAGINYCDEFGVTKADCDRGQSPQGPVTGNKNFADDVAYFMSHFDHRTDLPGDQVVYTYAVGFETNDPVSTAFLKSIAKAGDGKFYSASDASGLAQKVLEALDDINKRAISFSTAAISSVQTGSIQGALIPRFRPQKKAVWKGELWRFRLFNEFVEEADKDGDLATDPGYMTEMFVVDEAGKVVVEDPSDGTFKQKGSSTLADPYWEAGEELRSLGWSNRNVLTVLDSSGDGYFTDADDPIAFSQANLATILPYLGLTDEFCTVQVPAVLQLALDAAATTIGYAINDADAATRLNACGQLVMDYVRGKDIFDSDGDGNRNETRVDVLTDSFHSSPLVLDPPVDKFLCDMALHGQCVRTLYAQDLNTTPTPMKDDYQYTEDGVTRTRDAYEEFLGGSGYCGGTRCSRRPKLVLVGSNGGMVHAFNNGTFVADPADGEVYPRYTDGTGREEWAFIPPDLLPKLKLLMLHQERHHYFVDGDVMAREIWVDLNNDGEKTANEYKTVAVFAEGRGGTHYFALDLTNPTSPDFRWLFPQPCTREAVEFGQTYYSLAPKPPPIGPVLLEKTGGTERYGVETEERWAVMVSGGYHPQHARGRGAYLLDAWRGKVGPRDDNLLWAFRHEKDKDVVKAMTWPVAAPVAMVDYGPSSDPIPDGFFDSAVFGDVGGQVWVTRMFVPGEVDSTTGLVTNWSGGRAFQQDKDGLPQTTPDTSDEIDPETGDVRSLANRNPFFFMPSIAIQPDTKYLRAYLGSGDRANLQDTGIGQCRLENPMACAKYGCGKVKSVLELKVAGGTKNKLKKGEMHYGAISYAHAPWDVENDGVAACGDLKGKIKTELDKCPGSFKPGTVKEITVDCVAGECTTNRVALVEKDFEEMANEGKNNPQPWPIPSTIGTNRFYGFWAYGMAPARVFDETLALNSNDASGPKAYDTARLTDTGGTSGYGDFTNVTDVTVNNAGAVTSSGPTGTPASSTSKGWFIDYLDSSETRVDELSEKTATGSSLMASCVLWNSMQPQVAQATCGSAGENLAYVYQADFLTGSPDCAASFKNTDTGIYDRKQSRQVLAPPPEWNPVKELSKTGRTRTTAALLEPGKDQATQVTVDEGNDILQLIYEIPVSYDAHLCRHVDGSHCN